MINFLCEHQALIVTALMVGLVAMFPFRHVGVIQLPRRQKAKAGRKTQILVQDPIDTYKSRRMHESIPIHHGKTPASLSGTKLIAINPGNRWKEAIELPEEGQ